MSTSSFPRPAVVPGVALAELAALAGVGLVGVNENTPAPITGITLRAQDVRPGDLFAALPGTRVHGACYADDAARAGAVAVLTDQAGATAMAAGDRDGAGAGVGILVVPDVRKILGPISSAIYGHPSRKLSIIGVTGTSGKTTTCYLVEAILDGLGIASGLIGTVQTRIRGVATKSGLTTPEAPDLQGLFATMVEQGVQAVAMEVSSHALELGRVTGTRFAVGAFTNLSQDHLDFHPDMESYFEAKALLFDGRAEVGVVDVDDDYGRRLADRNPGTITVSGQGLDANWSVQSVLTTTAGVQQVALRTPDGGATSFELALPGQFNVANATIALACVDAIGCDVAAAARSLAGVVVPGRMERVDLGQPFLAVVDYAHKPGALTAVLSAIAQGLTGRLIVVLGAGGDRDKGKRSMMGAVAAAWADLVVVTDDNPRSESPAAIRSAVLSGARTPTERLRPGSAEILEIGDRHEAIRAAVRMSAAQDAVVIAGKGHERGQEVAGVVHAFSDRAELEAAIAGRVR